MKKCFYLGVDIGTHESKAVLIDQYGRVITLRTKAHGVDNPAPGWFSHDADRVWWGDFCFLCKNVIEAAGITAGEIGCIGLSALGCDCVPVDKEGKAMAPAVLYGIDSRSREEIGLILKKYGEEEAARLFGHAPCSSDIAPKILWFKRHMPKVWENAHKFLTASSYLCGRLTGRFVIDPYLAEDFLPLYQLREDDPSKRGIDRETAGDFCRPEQLAELLPATAIAGYVTKKAASETGLMEGTPVLTGTGDSGAEAVSTGFCREGDLMIQLGSSAYMILLSSSLIEEPRLWPGTFIIPGSYGICAGTNTAGALTEWLRNLFYSFQEADGKEHGQKRDPDREFQQMEKEADAIPPGSDGLLCLPYWAGERTPVNDPDAKGIFFGLQPSHTRGTMIRAALEGICYSIRDNVDLMRQHGLSIRRILAVGGGTKNAVWLQCLADILEEEILVPEVTVGASYGDALMAALAAGAFDRDEKKTSDSTDKEADAADHVSSGKETARWEKLAETVRISRTIRPAKEHQKIYRAQFALWKELYARNKDLMHRLS